MVIGGTSLFGGIGTRLGDVPRPLIISMINNLLNLMNVSPYSQGIAKGLIILIAITLYKTAGGVIREAASWISQRRKDGSQRRAIRLTSPLGQRGDTELT